jgi:hypothetical protein
VPGKRMNITLSADHRVTDGAEVARFLQVVKRSLEHLLTIAFAEFCGMAGAAASPLTVLTLSGSPRNWEWRGYPAASRNVAPIPRDFLPFREPLTAAVTREMGECGSGHGPAC